MPSEIQCWQSVRRSMLSKHAPTFQSLLCCPMLAIRTSEHAIEVCSDVSITIMLFNAGNSNVGSCYRSMLRRFNHHYECEGECLGFFDREKKGGATAMLNDDINLRRRVFSDVFDLNFHCPQVYNIIHFNRFQSRTWGDLLCAACSVMPCVGLSQCHLAMFVSDFL